MSLKIPGTELEVGGRTLVFAPLNAAAYKQYGEPKIERLLEGGISPDLLFVAKLAHASLSRNYPEMTLEEVEDLVDMGNVAVIYETVMCVSGYMRSIVKMAGAAGVRVPQELLPESNS